MGCPKIPTEEEIIKKFFSKRIKRRSFLKQLFMSIMGFYGIGALLGQKSNNKIKRFIEGIIEGKIEKGSRTVKYRRLGKTELMVSEVGVGGHSWAWGLNTEQHTKIDIVRTALDLGINYFDSTYPYESRTLGMLLKELKARERCVIAVGEIRPMFHIVNADEKRIRENVEEHLRALQTDRIDILRIIDNHGHFEQYTEKAGLDRTEEIRGIVEIFERLKKEGKIRFTCFTTHKQNDFIPYVYTADIGKLFDCMMIRYNLLETGPEKRVIPYAKDHDMGIIVLKPFLAGALLNKVPDSGDLNLRNIQLRPPSDPIFADLKHKDKGLAYALLRFILSNRDISVAIPAVRTVEQVIENAAASIFA